MIGKNIFIKKANDYSYLIIFFLLFAFSVFFIIRPTLVNLFSLKRELLDLENINRIYDDKIINFGQLQQFLETNRESLVYLDEAIPDKPNLNKIIDDLYKTASGSGLTFDSLNTPEVNLKEKQSKQYQPIVFDIQMSTDFDKMMIFLENLLNQRRLKSIKKLLVSATEESSPSSELKINMQIEVGYL